MILDNNESKNNNEIKKVYEWIQKYTENGDLDHTFLHIFLSLPLLLLHPHPLSQTSNKLNPIISCV